MSDFEVMPIGTRKAIAKAIVHLREAARIGAQKPCRSRRYRTTALDLDDILKNNGADYDHRKR